MTFKQYQHIERFGNDEVQNIELGKTYIFPKLDGTNSSVWVDKIETGYKVSAGSRMRELSLEKDNAGFLSWLSGESDAAENFNIFSLSYPQLRVFGEWLVPHTFKGYREDAWRKFYVFDVLNDETDQYMSYEAYKPLLDEFGIDYIPPLAIITNGSYDNFQRVLSENRYLCPDNGEPGEGIVLKNYDFYNRFGRQVWAKIIRQEFKDQFHKVMGPPEIGGKMNEELILDRCLSVALIDKTIAKILWSEDQKSEQVAGTSGWSSKYIPRLLETVFYDIIKEELWDSWKDIKFGSINGKTLKALTINRIKQLKPELF